MESVSENSTKQSNLSAVMLSSCAFYMLSQEIVWTVRMDLSSPDEERKKTG